MELDATAQLELVDEAIRALRPRLRQAVAELLPGQRAHEAVVERVQDPEGRDLGRRARGVQPGRRDRDVPGDGRLARRRRSGPPPSGPWRASERRPERGEVLDPAGAMLWTHACHLASVRGGRISRASHLPRVPPFRQAYRRRKAGKTSRPNSSTVRTGSAARLTVNIRLRAPASSAAPTWLEAILGASRPPPGAGADSRIPRGAV